jgi:imidazolonepropionase
MESDRRLFTGTGRLLTPRPAELGDWGIAVEDGRIGWVGPLRDAPAYEQRIDLGDALVTPGLVDPHSHPVYAGDRSDEAAARLAGARYDGGGILRTVAATRGASDEDLEGLVEGRLGAQVAAGTTTVECKSGYGLSTDEELRALRIVTRVAERLPVRVVRTFLGAHARPPDDRAYVDRLVEEMVPAVAAEGLAEFCDVFCEDGFFSPAETERILRAAADHGLAPRLHADQLTRGGGAELAVRLGAVSADHLEQLDQAGVAALASSSTVATLLPGPAVVMRDGLPPARALLDAGVTVALGSDANAGTFGAWGAMPLVIGLGATLLEMTVEEAIVATTTGAAAALALTGRRGILAVGADADLVAWDADHEGAFALRLGAVRPLRTFIGGVEAG